jgi:hypothetical protein
MPPRLCFRALEGELMSATSLYAQPEQAPIAWLVMLRAVDAFREHLGRFPSSSSHTEPGQASDALLLAHEARAILTAHGIDESIWAQVITEKHAAEMYVAILPLVWHATCIAL